VEEIPSHKKHSTLYRYDKDEVILEEGEHSSFVHILVDGTLGIYKGKEKVNEIKGKGLVFGEMSSILSRPRTTSVIAESECEVMVYRGGLPGIIKRFPHVTEKIVAQLAERIEEMNRNYCKLQDEYQKLKDDNFFLAKELKVAERKLKQSLTAPSDDAGAKASDSGGAEYIDDGFILGYPSRKKKTDEKHNDK